MAYNPGVSDISGQLRAQGMTRGMNSLLEGFDVGVKTYQQNKHIADTSIAKFGAAVANSDALKTLLTDENERSKLPSDVVKAYLKLNKEGSLGVQEASLLGGFADSYMKTEEDRQQREVRAQQIAASKQAGIFAEQANKLAQAQGVRQQTDFANEEAMNQKFRDLVAIGVGGSPNDAEPEEYADPEGARKRQREYDAAKEFLGSSAGKIAAQGVRLTPELTARLSMADQTNNTRISVAEEAANQRAAAAVARASAAEAKLGRNPVSEIVDIDLAIENGEITRDEGARLKQAIRVKKGTVPESLSSQIESAVSRGMGGKGTGTGTPASTTLVTEGVPQPPKTYPKVGPSQADRRRIPLGTEFMTNETPPRLMYKDKNGDFGFGPLPTK
jgi:hypothetical protein